MNLVKISSNFCLILLFSIGCGSAPENTTDPTTPQKKAPQAKKQLLKAGVLVIGGSPPVDSVFKAIDPHSTTIAMHSGIMKDRNWNIPGYWDEAATRIESLYGPKAFRMAFLDQGSESWLEETAPADLPKFLDRVLAPNGLFVMKHFFQFGDQGLDPAESTTPIHHGLKTFDITTNTYFVMGYRDSNPPVHFEYIDIWTLYSRKGLDITPCAVNGGFALPAKTRPDLAAFLDTLGNRTGFLATWETLPEKLTRLFQCKI